MTEIETKAKNYAINRRKESYDAESEIFELENAGVLKPDEIEKVIEDVRTEAFIAGVNSILNHQMDINWHYNEIPQKPYAIKYLIERVSPLGSYEFATFVPASLFNEKAYFKPTRSGEYSSGIVLDGIRRWCELEPGEAIDEPVWKKNDDIRNNWIKLLGGK